MAEQAAQVTTEGKQLKSGWQMVKFGDVVRQVKDKVDPRKSGLKYYVAGEHMDTDDLKIRRWGEIGPDYLGPAFHMRFKPGQVLYGSRRTYLRKVAVPDFEGICADTTFVLESKDPNILLPELLPFIMQTERFHEHSIKQLKGSVNPYVNFSDLAWFEFALPPLEEQRRLVKAFKTSQYAKDTLENAKNDTEKLKMSLLIEIFTQLEHSGTINIKTIKRSVQCQRIKMEQAGDILMGRQLSPKYKNGLSPKPYLRVANVFDGYIDTTDIKEMDFSESEFETFKLEKNDILLNEGQSRELVGRSAIYKEEIENCCFQNTLIRFRPKEQVISEYAHYFFQYCLYTGQFMQISKQTTSVAHLGVQRFAKMQFPLIEKEAQEAVVELISATNQAISNFNSRLVSVQNIYKILCTQGLA